MDAVAADGSSMTELIAKLSAAVGARYVLTADDAMAPHLREERDLFRRPLLAAELARFDAVVFDPPRAGAEAQARQIAASEVNTAIAVSCDTGTFARDANILVAAGFRLEEVTPVDQFRYSAHLELVGVFRRGRRPGAARKHRNS